jgi:transcriptional regulator with XRE-family HTH domain
MKNLNDVISELAPEDRAKVMARARELIGEEMALQHLRKARRLTQERMAELLHIGQDSVSRIERRSDLLISTLQSYVEAMGGALKLVVQFPDGVATLSGWGEDHPEKTSKPKKTSKRTASKRTSVTVRPKRRHLELAHAD